MRRRCCVPRAARDRRAATSRREADRDRRAERRKILSDAANRLAADGVEDDVDRLELVEAVVGDRLGGAERARQLELLLEPAAATTSAPSARAACTAALPDAAGSRGHEHAHAGPTFTCRVSGIQAVRKASRNAAPSSNDASAGRSNSHSSSSTARSA